MHFNKRTTWIALIFLCLTIAVMSWFYVSYRVISTRELTDDSEISEFEDSQASGVGVERVFRISPETITKTHILNEDSCPNDFINEISLTGPQDGTWMLDPKSVPDWLDVSEMSGELPYKISDLSFNCDILNLTEHTETARLNFQASNELGLGAGQAYLDITLKIKEVDG